MPKLINLHLSVILIIVFLLFFSCTQPEPPVPVKIPPAVQKKGAEHHDIERLTSTYFKGLPQEELKDLVLLAKKINAFVHNYCTCELPLENNVDNLIKNCRTSCGGYVYVFRKISGYYGIQSREVYLYNIPLQGNHSMVEIKYGEDKWALFDPTFGTFFTHGGEISEIPYSLDDLYFNCSPKNLLRHVVQAKDFRRVDMASPVDDLYTPRSFKAPNMSLSAYLYADSYGYPAPFQYSLLWMEINMKRDVFQFGGPAKTIEEGDRQFLAKTNVLINDKILNNHISYDMSFLGQMGEHTYKNGYRIFNLKKGCIYRITLYGINPTGVSLYPHFTDSRAVLQRTGIQIIPDDIYIHSQLFRARDSNADLILESYPAPRRFMRIFGIRIELSKTVMPFAHQPHEIGSRKNRT